MAYMNQETKKKIVAAVKPILAQYRLKASFSVRYHSSIVVTLKSGKVDFITNYIDTLSGQPGDFNDMARRIKYVNEESYLGVNQYWLDNQFSGTALCALKDIYRAIKQAGNWFDKSDIQTDYFNTAFYIDLSVGSYDKPYTVE